MDFKLKAYFYLSEADSDGLKILCLIKRWSLQNGGVYGGGFI